MAENPTFSQWISHQKRYISVYLLLREKVYGHENKINRIEWLRTNFEM